MAGVLSTETFGWAMSSGCRTTAFFRKRPSSCDIPNLDSRSDKLSVRTFETESSFSIAFAAKVLVTPYWRNFSSNFAISHPLPLSQQSYVPYETLKRDQVRTHRCRI